MKKSIVFVFQLLVYASCTFSIHAQTVNVNYSGTDTVRTCDTSLFSATFTLPAGNHHISIADSVNLPCANPSCTADQLSVFHVVSGAAGDFTWDAGTHSWIIDLNSMGDTTYTLTYSVRLDCSLVPGCFDSVISSLIFYQKWRDTTSVIFNVDSTGTNQKESVILYPHFKETTSLNFYGNYLDTVSIYHVYENNGTMDADIQFSFIASPFNSCSSDTIWSVYYAVGDPSDPSLLSYNDTLSAAWDSVSVATGEALVVRKNVIVRECIDASCTHERDTLVWKCNFNDVVFCQECQHLFDQEYGLLRNDTSAISVTRLIPASTLDTTCMGDSIHWQYKIKNTGRVNFAHALIQLYSAAALFPNQLLLIDTGSINITPYLSPVTTLIDSIFVNGYALCSPDIISLNRLKIHLFNFMKNDSLVVDFYTFKCCEENDAAIFPYGGVGYGSWKWNTIGYDSCGAAGINFVTDISRTAGWGLDADYFPTVSDLTVPHDSTFGPSTDLLFIDLTSTTWADSNNYQLFGCSGNPASCIMNGLLRVHIHCDVGLVVDTPLSYIANFPLDTARIWKPVFNYSTHQDGLCDTADYYYYFDLADTNAYYLLKRSRFYFRLRSCCYPPTAETPYAIAFHILTNPHGNCYNIDLSDTSHTQPPVCNDCCYLPMTSTGDKIAIRCPGCLAPGIEVNSYWIERINLGAKDGNNNGRADTAIAVIDSAYLSVYESMMRITSAHHGDLIEDHMMGHFQDGDSAGGGYTYQQMLDGTSVLHFLQLDRTFTLEDSVSNMEMTPYYFKFYIDTPYSVNANCVDCEEFKVDTNYRTMHIIEVSASAINAYVQTYNPDFRLLFTFDATANDSTHNLYQNIFFQDSILPFNGFYPKQRYRMKTNYSVCGRFTPHAHNNQSDLEKQQKAQILNNMYLCGIALPPDAIDTLREMPNNTSEVASFNFDIDSLTQAFADTFRFVCSTMGGRFYFYADQAVNFSGYQSDTANACKKFIQIEPYFQTGGESYSSLFPYEYRLPSIFPYRLAAEVPLGFTLDTVATISSGFQNTWSIPVSFIVHQQGDSVIIRLDSLINALGLNCLADTSNNITSQLYIADNRLDLKVIIKLLTANCDSNAFFEADTADIRAWFKDYTSSCFDANGLHCDTLFIDQPRPSGSETLQLPNPYLSIYFSPSNVPAQNHKVCWNMIVENDSDYAYNVFILPQNVSYLSNWTIEHDTTILQPDSSGVFHYKNALAPDSIITTDMLCAIYDSCVGSATFNVYYGWNCEGFPEGYDTSACALYNTQIGLTDEQTDPDLEQESKDTINLCDPFTIRAVLSNSDQGSIYPFVLYLDSLNSSLSVLSLQLVSCSLQDTITIPGSPPYTITPVILDSIGINEDSTLSDNEHCMIVLINVEAACGAAFEAGDTVSLPHIHIQAETYCRDTLDILDRVIPPAPLDFNAIYSGMSHCNDCFTLEKTASQDSVEIGDTVSFYIFICGYNDSVQTINLTEYLPSDFDTLPGSVIPASLNIPADSCVTITIKGIFQTAGSCSDSSHINIVEISNANMDTVASACVAVMEPCTLGSIIIADSTFSSQLGNDTLLNSTFYIAGRFYVDSNFTFINCIIYTNSGAQIIVDSAVFTLDSTVIVGCDTMWRGIYVHGNKAQFIETNGSDVRDAEFGLHTNTAFKILKSAMTNCVTGIYIPPFPVQQHPLCIVQGSNFGLDSAGFKPDFNGQTPHGVLPKAGILLNDAAVKIGADTAQHNRFYNMNTGVIGFRSGLKIYNSLFSEIQTDTFYHKAYSGTAMVSIGDKDSAKAGNLTVMPQVSATPMVQNSYRGIYTGYSSLSATGVNFVNLNTGVYSSRCADLLTSVVSNCKMEVSRYGIYWINNKGAQYMTASQDTIVLRSPAGNAFIKGGTGAIALMETNKNLPGNYSVFNNTISIDSAWYGILASGVHKPNITFNKININAQTPQVAAKGITISGCDSASVTCNDILGKYPVDSSYHAIGIATNVSTRNSITCNTVDSTYYGVFFGGFSPSRFKGNGMNTHFEGLHLNSAAVIDTQAHAGNLWWGPFTGYGAANFNSTQPGIAASTFVVDSSASFPSSIFPVTGWFLPALGNTFNCSNSTVCTVIQDGDISEELARRIAGDSLQTSEFEFESQIMAEMYLYEQLKNDTDLLASDSIYRQFMQTEEFSSTAYLYEASKDLKAVAEYDSTFTSLIMAADSVINMLTDSIDYINTHPADLTRDWDAVKDSMAAVLAFMEQTRGNLIAQRELFVYGKLSQGSFNNEIAVPVGLPDSNEQYINDIEILTELYGIDTASSYYNNIFTIAQQCPYAGGPAVYRARAFIAILNDDADFVYDDITACLLVGIYRKSQPVKAKENSSIQIIPNPANDYLKIILNNSLATLCKISIFNSVAEKQIEKILDCKQNEYVINISNLSQGAYYIKVNLNDEPVQGKKLMIIR